LVATYYEVLGVPVNAPPEDLRRAYLALARALHPDRTIGMSPVDSEHTARRMQQVNEAWRVLRDPPSRAAYDRALVDAGRRVPRPASAPRVEDPDFDTPFQHTPAHPGDVGVSIARWVPWLSIAVVLMAIFIFTAFAGPKHKATSPRNLVGQCISSGNASAVVPVPCEGPNDGKVVVVVDSSSACPTGSTSRPDGAVWLCLAPVHPVPTAAAP
jgi:hypothetical protein